MRSILILFLVGCLHLGAEGCGARHDNVKFVEKVTSNFSRNSYFIFLKIETPDTTLSCVIDNGSLYYYFYKQKGWDESQYQDFIRPVLQSKDVLRINDGNIEKLGFVRVGSNDNIRSDIREGKDFVIQKYFRNRVIKGNISDDDKFFLIAAIYKWGVASSIDDESGYLVLSE